MYTHDNNNVDNNMIMIIMILDISISIMCVIISIRIRIALPPPVNDNYNGHRFPQIERLMRHLCNVHGNFQGKTSERMSRYAH